MVDMIVNTDLIWQVHDILLTTSLECTVVMIVDRQGSASDLAKGDAWILFTQVLMVMWSMHASTGSTKLRQTDCSPASLWETCFSPSPLTIACNWIGLVLHASLLFVAVSHF